MPFSDITNRFARIWRFVDNFVTADAAERADFDTAFGDLEGGLNDAIEYLEGEIEASVQGVPLLGIKEVLPETDDSGGPLQPGSLVVVDALFYSWDGADWIETGGDHGASAIGLQILRAANAAAIRTSIGLGTTALLNFNPSDITGAMTFADNVPLRLGTDLDLIISHDGTNSRIQEAGAGGLFIDTTLLTVRNSAGTKTGLTVAGDGVLTGYFDNAQKFVTSAEGLTVTGALSADVVAGNWLATLAEQQAGTSATKILTPDGGTKLIEARRSLSALVATASGTSVTLASGIPSWARKVTLHFDRTSLDDGSGHMLVRLGNAGGLISTGYESSTSGNSGTQQQATSGLLVLSGSAGRERTGHLLLTRVSTLAGNHRWISSHSMGSTTGDECNGGGALTFAGPLTEIQIVASAGNFSNGGIYVEYEA